MPRLWLPALWIMSFRRRASTQRREIPEVTQLLRHIGISHDFVDHATVSIQLALPLYDPQVLRWPRPARIPWDKLDTNCWNPPCELQISDTLDSTDFLATWAQSFEATCSDRLMQDGGTGLRKHCCGRAQRLVPQKQSMSTPMCKPSRPGEIHLFNAATGLATRQWFKQLRRIQSLKHAIHANSQTPHAVDYRALLWGAILRAAGFVPNFRIWWQQRIPHVDGFFVKFPQGPLHLVGRPIYSMRDSTFILDSLKNGICSREQVV